VIVRAAALLLGLVGAMVFVMQRVRPVGEPAPVPNSSDLTVESVVVPKAINPGYLGPQVCAECHAERVAEFRSTRHFRANCVPDAGSMPAGFAPGKGTFAVPGLPDLRFEMHGADGGFGQTTYQRTVDGEKKTESPIAFIFGSAGGNDEVYFTWRGDRLYELPMVWLAPTAEWGASPFDRRGTGDFSRDMTVRCLECHNTWFEHVTGSRNQYGHENFILGVTCEVCHGPGRAHVEHHRLHPDDRNAHAVVRPARLSRERQIDLCAQCHSNALKHRGPAFGYRPGEPLDDFYYTLRTSHPEEDHVANQTTYLRQSRCFQESESLTCVTCHDPHRPQAPTNAGAASCAKCHDATDCIERPRLPHAVRDECVGCHMPTARKIQVFLRTERDSYVAPVKRFEHRIGIYPAARDEILLAWYRTQADPASAALAARHAKLLGEYWRGEAADRRRDYRILAAIDACREALRFDPLPATREELQELIAAQTAMDADLQDGLWHEREGRYEQAVNFFRRVLTVKPDRAWAHAKLGATYAAMGKKRLARDHLADAARYDRDDPYPPAMLGWLAYLDGHYEEALEQYRHAEEVEPYSAKINWQIGLALARLERWTEAAERFTRVVQIDPNDVGGYHGLSQALRQANKPDEAVSFALRAAELTRFQDTDVLLNLAESYADAGRRVDAAKVAGDALDAARAGNRRLEPQVRVRLEGLQSKGQRR
jgi:tetratricopeptide (TPR) repeat protein